MIEGVGVGVLVGGGGGGGFPPPSSPPPQSNPHVVHPQLPHHTPHDTPQLHPPVSPGGGAHPQSYARTPFGRKEAATILNTKIPIKRPITINAFFIFSLRVFILKIHQSFSVFILKNLSRFFSAKARIRTWVAVRREFYRLVRLTAPPPWQNII